MKHLFDNSDINVYTKEYCNFSVGAPGPDLLEKCCDIMKEATIATMNHEKANNSYLFQYGPSAGTVDFREALAAFLSRNYGSPVRDQDLILTAGASHGMHLLWTLVMHPSALIIVDEVTYMIALEAMTGFPGFKIVSCPLQEDGPDVDAMEKILGSHVLSKPNGTRYPCMYYTVPVFHNPTGITFSEAKCKAVIRLSRQYDMLVACDDVYNLLNYPEDDSNKVTRLIALDDPTDTDYKGTVISNGSFSKIFSPGIRVGWIESPRWVNDVLQNSGIIRSGGAVNNYTSGIMTTVMKSGRMDETLQLYRQEYRKRMKLACDILCSDLNPQVKFSDPRGGYFIWLVFPREFDVNAFNQRLKTEYKVFGIPGGRFSITKGAQNCLRLCVVFHPLDVIEKGIRQLCLASHKHIISPAE